MRKVINLDNILKIFIPKHLKKVTNLIKWTKNIYEKEKRDN